MFNYDVILARDSFLLFAELRIFWLVSVLYGLCAVLYLFHALTRADFAGRAALFLLWVGAIIHVGLILFRTFEAGRAPFQTLYESLSWFAASTTLTYLYVSRNWKDVHLPGLFTSVLACGACFYALISRSPAVEPLSPPLKSYWFEWHVSLAFLSYAVFVVSASIEATYLVVKPLLRSGMPKVYGLSVDTVEEFHSRALRLAAFGFPLLTFAIASGAAWANESWGKYWSWDPKETWSLITWTVFTIYLHAMTIPGLRGLPASVFNLLGFVCMIMTFLGVNWLAKLLGIPSLHIYAV